MFWGETIKALSSPLKDRNKLCTFTENNCSLPYCSRSWPGLPRSIETFPSAPRPVTVNWGTLLRLAGWQEGMWWSLWRTPVATKTTRHSIRFGQMFGLRIPENRKTTPPLWPSTAQDELRGEGGGRVGKCCSWLSLAQSLVVVLPWGRKGRDAKHQHEDKEEEDEGRLAESALEMHSQRGN